MDSLYFPWATTPPVCCDDVVFNGTGSIPIPQLLNKNLMNIIKQAALILIMALSFGAISSSAFAEEAGSSAIIAHIEKGLVEVSKSDFSSAQVHLKAARAASDQIAGNSDAAKQAHATLIQGQIAAKKGDVDSATEELNKAIEQFKAL